MSMLGLLLHRAGAKPAVVVPAPAPVVAPPPRVRDGRPGPACNDPPLRIEPAT